MFISLDLICVTKTLILFKNYGCYLIELITENNEISINIDSSLTQDCVMSYIELEVLPLKFYEGLLTHNISKILVI